MKEMVRYKLILDSGKELSTDFKPYNQEEADMFMNVHKNPREYDYVMISDKKKRIIVIPVETFLKAILITEVKTSWF